MPRKAKLKWPFWYFSQLKTRYFRLEGSVLIPAQERGPKNELNSSISTSLLLLPIASQSSLGMHHRDRGIRVSLSLYEMYARNSSKGEVDIPSGVDPCREVETQKNL